VPTPDPNAFVVVFGPKSGMAGAESPSNVVNAGPVAPFDPVDDECDCELQPANAAAINASMRIRIFIV